ncbi:hypothetical protein [Cellulomonas phragmiteti]|uniref:hypothetical protein n=1 Tax=Cellulomonas phragmiteti TaxID=478780 RepID=UPI00194430A0|nr:hypothetical protein [Cellulomonas phragmiteti]
MTLVLFALVALVAAIVTDLHDRSLPQGLGARAAVTLDFADAHLGDQRAFTELARVSEEGGLGLVRVAADLTGGGAGTVYVPVGPDADVPSSVATFGGRDDVRVAPPEALANSFATGEYLVTRAAGDREALETWAAQHRVSVDWAEADLVSTLQLVVREASFASSLLAASVLTVTLVLFWLSVRARGRAVRVLGGVPAWRIQLEDVGGFLAAVAVAAAAVVVLATAVVAVGQGAVFVPFYLRTLLVLSGAVVATSAVAALAVSAASWPTAESLASRRSPVTGLRGVTTVVAALVFTLVVSAVGPAVTAWNQASRAAEQQATWYALADQVSLVFPSALGEEGFVELMPAVGALLADAEEAGGAALSSTWASEPAYGYDLGEVGHLALVNQDWLDLMRRGSVRTGSGGLVQVPAGQVPAEVRDFLVPSLEIWSRDPRPGEEVYAQLQFYRVADGVTLPMATAGGGELEFLDDALVAVVPALHQTFDDDFLASLTSSQNIVLTGLAPTLELVRAHGLEGSVEVRYVAEAGALQAQYTAHFAWLRGVSLLALAAALTLTAAVGALITAMLRARRDFPMRLAGRSWAQILAPRVGREVVAGLAITALVVAWQEGRELALVVTVAALALLVSPLTHLAAARWSFTNLGLRKQ